MYELSKEKLAYHMSVKLLTPELVKTGLQVRSLVPFYLIPTGMLGTIIETYQIGEGHFGVTIRWNDTNVKDGFNTDEFKYLEVLD